MEGAVPRPLVLRFEIAHGVVARRGLVLLEVLEAKGSAREAASAAYYQLFRDGVLDTEHHSHQFFVSAAGRYKALGIWDDGRAGETPEVLVTAGMIRDAAHRPIDDIVPSIVTFDPHTHKFDPKTGKIVPRLWRPWYVLVAGLVFVLLVAALLW